MGQTSTQASPVLSVVPAVRSSAVSPRPQPMAHLAACTHISTQASNSLSPRTFPRQLVGVQAAQQIRRELTYPPFDSGRGSAAPIVASTRGHPINDSVLSPL